MRWTLAFFLVGFLLVACSGSDGAGDAGQDAAGDAGQDAGEDGGGDPAPGPVFSLRFESGAQACARFSESRTAAQELALGARLHFKTQDLSLPSDADFFQADLLDSVELGPEGLTASPTGPGEFSYVLEDELWGWCPRYVFTQTFTFDTPPRPRRAEA